LALTSIILKNKNFLFLKMKNPSEITIVRKVGLRLHTPKLPPRNLSEYREMQCREVYEKKELEKTERLENLTREAMRPAYNFFGEMPHDYDFY